VLCYFEGLTHAQAASALRCGEATLRRRLAKARDQLRARLSRRGFAPEDAVLGVMLARETTAAVPMAWAAATLRAVMRVAAGEAVAVVAGARVTSLCRGGLDMIAGSVWNVTVAALISTGAAVMLAVGLAAGNGRDDPAATSESAPATPANSPRTGGKPADANDSQITGDRITSFPPIVMSKQTESSPFRFVEIAKSAGIDFVHFSGMTEDKHFPTTNGSGVAVFDYDNDGLLDIYFATATLLPLGMARKGPNRLYKNMGSGRFRDMTEASGLGYRGFCHGIIAGDIDNDGDTDVFLCNYGSNVLYVNNGDGTFKDISKAAGIDASNWSSGGAMLDYDNDGYLDIYVANYGIWRFPEDHQSVGNAEKKIWLYASPRTIKTTRHFLYHNNGNLTFTNEFDQVITAEEEVYDPATKARTKKRVPKPRDDGHGFGVVAADVNNDGLIDLYVANEMNPNFLFLNCGDGTFVDVSESSGAAFNVNGMAQSGKGVDAEDVNGDGLPDLFVTNFTNEYNTVYQNFGKGVFFDNTAFFGLAADSMPWVGWGCALADFDNDGWPDCFVANGHVDNNRRQLGQPVDYEEIPLLFCNVQGRRFKLSTEDVGPYFDTGHVARGAAFGDIDNDGDLDIVINHKDGSAALLRNDTQSRMHLISMSSANRQLATKNHWIRFTLQGTKSNRDAIGTKVEVTVDDRTIHRQRKGGYSLQGTNDPRILIGVGRAAEVKKVVIRWPSGIVQTLENLKVDLEYKVVEPKPAK
jgi:enediyne biosynthesis protein E4